MAEHSFGGRKRLRLTCQKGHRRPLTLRKTYETEKEKAINQNICGPSSMIKTLVLSHRVRAFLFFFILVANSLAPSIPRPIPAKEWMVTPPMLQAAMPGDDDNDQGQS